MKWLTNIFNKLRPKQKLATNYNSGKTFDEMYNDIGVFTYHDDGFTIVYGNLNKTLKWDDITQVNVYKVDLMTIDEVEMEIVYGDWCFTINEEVPGWYQFILKLKESFPEIPADWETEVMFPAFAINYRTIFNRMK